jgi:hypothetical protein
MTEASRQAMAAYKQANRALQRATADLAAADSAVATAVAAKHDAKLAVERLGAERRAAGEALQRALNQDDTP